MPIFEGVRRDRARPVLGLLLGALLLSGCEQPGVSGSSPTRTTVTAGGRPVTIAAPLGFCIDARSTTVTSKGAFVLISDCTLLGQATAVAGRPPIGAALTASVSPLGLGDDGPATRSLADLEKYVHTPAGLVLVGRDERSGDARVLRSEQREGVLYVLVEDHGQGPAPGLAPLFWRAFTEVNGRLTAVAELSFEVGGLDEKSGLSLVAAFVAAIRAANPVVAAAGPAAG